MSPPPKENELYDDEDLLALSGLQHLAYCERQWALIHVEGQWAENRLTAEGRIFHERTELTETEVRGDIREARGLRLRSLRLGIVGRADLVEFHRVESGAGIKLSGADGKWRPRPVEYKLGKPKPDHRDHVQLCGQALCLEEMLEIETEDGSLFYGKPRRREKVQFDPKLRAQTEELAERMHELMTTGTTPPPTPDESRCNRCSLQDRCLPDVTRECDVRKYLREQLEL
ncbi:MAG: CRISPR-associated protein Cas4 [Planctomycetota bacterium]